MIDIHTHILPGHDDGSQTIEESLMIIRKAYRDGIKIIVATPHVLESPNESICKKITNSILELKQELTIEGINVEIISGAEVFISSELPKQIKKHSELTINNGNKYILIELPMHEIPPFTEQTIFELVVSGIIPIISHPERYIEIQKNPNRLFDLVKKGALTQLNSGSLMGRYGKKVRETAKTLLSNNLIHMMGSDVHSNFNGSYPLSQGLNIATEIVGIEVAREMVTSVPEKVIHGEIVKILPPKSPKESIFKRLLSSRMFCK